PEAAVFATARDTGAPIMQWRPIRPRTSDPAVATDDHDRRNLHDQLTYPAHGRSGPGAHRPERGARPDRQCRPVADHPPDRNQAPGGVAGRPGHRHPTPGPPRPRHHHHTAPAPATPPNRGPTPPGHATTQPGCAVAALAS